MNAKAKGTHNEHRSIRLLEAAGHRCCRPAASLGAGDIIGVGSTDMVLVQVKSNAWPGMVGMEKLASFTTPGICRRPVLLARPAAAAGGLAGCGRGWQPTAGTGNWRGTPQTFRRNSGQSC